MWIKEKSDAHVLCIGHVLVCVLYVYACLMHSWCVFAFMHLMCCWCVSKCVLSTHSMWISWIFAMVLMSIPCSRHISHVVDVYPMHTWALTPPAHAPMCGCVHRCRFPYFLCEESLKQGRGVYADACGHTSVSPMYDNACGWLLGI